MGEIIIDYAGKIHLDHFGKGKVKEVLALILQVSCKVTSLKMFGLKTPLH